MEVGYFPSLVNHYINSVHGKRYIAKVRTQQVGQANVNGSKLKNMPIPIMDRLEQYQILQQIESVQSQYLAMMHDFQKNIKAMGHLRNGILKSTFSGLLTEQQHEDEPASELLNRIKAKKGGK